MKQGIRGSYQAGCCNGFEVWGISARSPNWLATGTVNKEETPVPYDFEGQSEFQTLNSYGERVYKEVVPDVRTPVTPQSFLMQAVKVPSSFPYNDCNPKTYVDSGYTDYDGDGTFVVELPFITKHVESFDPETAPDYLHNWRYCFKSRAIYVDREQAYVMYVIGGEDPNWVGPDLQGPLIDGTLTGGQDEHGDHCLINIQTKELVRQYYMTTANGFIDGFGMTDMEQEYNNIYPIDVMYSNAAPDNVAANDRSGKQYAANCESFGKEYYIVSDYNPEALTWGVARVKYEGTRLGETEISGRPSMEVFATGHWEGGPKGNGNDGSLVEADYAGSYVIMLPSCRVYIDSSAPQPDECWVVAKTIFNEPKLVTGRWLSKVYRPGIGGEDEESGLADGTLSEAEVENVILPTEQTDTDFPDEEWDNLRVRGYNHINGKDYILFTANGDSADVLAEPLADFEEGDGGFDPNYVDNGIDDFGLSFNNGGTRSGDKWIADSGDSHDGTYAAKSNEGNVVFEGDVNLSVTVNVTGADDCELSFWFRLDNRWYGTRVPPFVELTNFPDVDNNLQVFVNGLPASMLIDFGTAHGSIGPETVEGIIDNNFFDEESEYLTWYQAKITLPAGTNTIRWSLHRAFQDNGHLHAWLDEIQFPQLLTGDDISGRKRYYYDGERVRRAEFWDWAQRDKENETEISGRASTEPDFITYDWYRERIYYGNPHATVAIRMDEGHEGELDLEFYEQGYARWTASPNIGKPIEPPCYDPDGEIVVPDVAMDPGWGATQIMPTSSGVQLRGVNAAVRDIDSSPFTVNNQCYSKTPDWLEQYQFFCQARGFAGRWSMRISSWTLKDNVRVPHIQVINRPTWRAPAWPEKPPYPVPPYTTYFEDWDGIESIETRWNLFRMRDERFLESDEQTYPRWSPYNWIVPRDYSDAFTRKNQFVWVHRFNDPPSDEFNPDWWHPDSSPGEGGNGPWESALWFLVQAYFCPTGIRMTDLREHNGAGVSYGATSVTPDELCPPEDDPEGEGPSAIIGRIHFPYFWPFTDFDAVDCNCGCCGNKGPLVLPPKRPGTIGGEGDENIPNG